MATDSYPDVAIADPTAIEHRSWARGSNRMDGLDHDHQHNKHTNQPQQQQHQGGAGRDTFVILQPNRRRYTLSQGQIVVTVIIIVLTLVIAILVTAFVSRADYGHVCPDCKSPDYKSREGQRQNGKTRIPPSGNKIDKASPPSSLPKTIKGGQPWSKIRLPRAFIPKMYEIRLQVDLDKFVFRGSLNITLRVNHSTRYIVFHRSYLEMDQSSVALTSEFSPPRSVVRQFEVKASHFHVVELDRDVEAGTMYTLSVGSFSGRVNQQLRGLYRSSYVINGETR